MPMEAGLEMSPSDLSSGCLAVRGLLRLLSNFSCYHDGGNWKAVSTGMPTGYLTQDAWHPLGTAYLAVFEGPTSWHMVQEPWAAGEVFVGGTWWQGGGVAEQMPLALWLPWWTLVPQ